MAVVTNTTTNRMYAPGETESSHPTMNYDAAGNQTKDTYSGAAVTRAYNAENRMTSEMQASSYVAGSYSYDGNGRRVKRSVGGVETWQVYGISGELIAEYAANASASSVQKEYGYRNGQLLVTLTSPLPGGTPTFTDNPIHVGETTVQALHITELRTAINNLRSHLGMAAYSWTTSATTSDYINANPIIEMRTALDQALGAPAGGYATGLAQNQLVKAIHIQELRDRLTAASGSDVRWLVTDQLGTPRMILDQSGSLANTSRHDYLPFGEEVGANIGARTMGQGYGASDNERKKFTGYERDTETGLDFAQARYHGNIQGRFTSPDPFSGSAIMADPQTFNRYAYCRNNPVNSSDPTGLAPGAMAMPSGERVNAARGMSDQARQIIAEDEARYERYVDDASSGLLNNTSVTVAISEPADSQQAKQADPFTKRNGNLSDEAVDNKLAEIFTKGGIVIGASSERNLLPGDSHFRLTNGKLHTIHIFGDKSGVEVTGVYIPKEFSKVRYVGGGTVTATNPKTGEIIAASHINVYSQKNLEVNLRSTNEMRSRYIGQIGGLGGEGVNDNHAHLSIYPSAASRLGALRYKGNQNNRLRDYDNSISPSLGDFRKLIH